MVEIEVPWNEVNSSHLKRVRYVKNDMQVQFADGSVYNYLQVPLRMYARLRNADSPGKFFNNEIKNQYKYTKGSEK